MLKKPFVGGAEVVETSLSARGANETVFRTLAVAGEAHVAFPAISWKLIGFVLSELVLKCRARHISVANLTSLHHEFPRFLRGKFRQADRTEAAMRLARE
jgi:hypothetical protein